jgi:CheY-like chemotaxis protein
MKTLLADDHPLMREGVRQVLAQLEPPVEIIDAHDYPSLFAQTALHGDLDLALVDLNMPGFVGMQGITRFRNRFPDIPLVVLSASESPHDIRSALEAGALGYIPKAASTADDAGCAAAGAGRRHLCAGLSRRQRCRPAHGGGGRFRGAAAQRADRAPARGGAPAGKGLRQQGHRRHAGDVGKHGEGAYRRDLQAPSASPIAPRPCSRSSG